MEQRAPWGIIINRLELLRKLALAAVILGVIFLILAIAAVAVLCSWGGCGYYGHVFGHAIAVIVAGVLGLIGLKLNSFGDHCLVISHWIVTLIASIWSLGL